MNLDNETDVVILHIGPISAPSRRILFCDFS